MTTFAPDTTPAGELQTLLASRVALVVIESREEARVMEVVREAALKAQRGRSWGVFAWSASRKTGHVGRCASLPATWVS